MCKNNSLILVKHFCACKIKLLRRFWSIDDGLYWDWTPLGWWCFKEERGTCGKGLWRGIRRWMILINSTQFLIDYMWKVRFWPIICGNMPLMCHFLEFLDFIQWSLDVYLFGQDGTSNLCPLAPCFC